MLYIAFLKTKEKQTKYTGTPDAIFLHESKLFFLLPKEHHGRFTDRSHITTSLLTENGSWIICNDTKVSAPSRNKPKLGLIFIYDKSQDSFNIQPEVQDGLSDSSVPIHGKRQQADDFSDSDYSKESSKKFQKSSQHTSERVPCKASPSHSQRKSSRKESESSVKRIDFDSSEEDENLILKDDLHQRKRIRYEDSRSQSGSYSEEDTDESNSEDNDESSLEESYESSSENNDKSISEHEFEYEYEYKYNVISEEKSKSVTKKDGGDPSLFKRIKKFFKKPENKSLEKCKDHSQYKDQKILTKSQKIRIKFVLNTETDDDDESETDESDELEIESTDELESTAIQDANIDLKLMQKAKSMTASDKSLLDDSNSVTSSKFNNGNESSKSGKNGRKNDL